MSAPLVSIVIPAYDAQPYVAEALSSCLSQTWGRTEVILVDDGSTDDTLQIARSLRDPRLKVVGAEHRGQSAAVNQGLALAQGDVIKTFDADDVLPSDCVALQVAQLDGRDDIVVSSAYRNFRRSVHDAEDEADSFRDRVSGLEWLKASLCPDRTPGHSAWLAPRRVVERAGPWNERLSLHNDYELVTRMLLPLEEVRFAEGAFYFYRCNVPKSLSARTSVQALDSAQLSVSLVVDHLLRAAAGDPAVRRLCANLLQDFVYNYCVDAPERIEGISLRVRELGGADVEPDGPPGFHLLRQVLGWRSARRIERWASRHGLNRAALSQVLSRSR